MNNELLLVQRELGKKKPFPLAECQKEVLIQMLKEEVVQSAISWFQIRAEHATDCIQDEYGYCIDAVVIDEHEAYKDFAKATEKLIAVMEGSDSAK